MSGGLGRALRVPLLLGLALLIGVTLGFTLVGPGEAAGTSMSKAAGSLAPKTAGSSPQSSFKSQPLKRPSAHPAGQPKSKPGEVIVEYGRTSTKLTMTRAAANVGVSLEKAHVSKSARSVSYAVYSSETMTTQQLVEGFRNQPGVVNVSPNYVRSFDMTPNDTFYPRMWGLENIGQVLGVADADIDAAGAWNYSAGSGVVVVSMDTGVDYTHEDLVGSMWHNSGEIPGDGIDNDANGYVDDIYGIDPMAGDSDPMDTMGHGTHTAGTMAATGNNGLGVAGVAWQAKVMALRCGDETGIPDDVTIACINYAIDMKVNHGVNIVAINASWGGEDPNPVQRDAIQAAGNAGIVFVAAAGNDDSNTDYNPVYPAGYDCTNIISVGASDSYDQPAWFSNYGRTSVDVFAPGVDILSTTPDDLFYVASPGDPFYDDMESGAGNWTETGTWAVTQEEYGLTPTHSWSDSPNANYLNNSNTSITSRTIDLHQLTSTGAVLSFVAGVDVEANYDKLWIEVSGDNGATWTKLGYLEGTSWNIYNLPIPSNFLTSQFRLSFRLETDTTVNYDGVYIDDIGISSPRYRRMSGTSMAAPHVTGALGLLAEVSPTDSPATRISRIMSTVDPSSGMSWRCVSGGRLNAGTAVAQAAGVAKRYEETDSHIGYYPSSWGTFASAGKASKDAYVRAKGSGTSAIICFEGTRLDWIAMRGTTTGKADVYLDNEFVQTVDLANPSGAIYQQMVWSTKNLSYKMHRVEIVWNPAGGTDKYVNLDAVDVVGTLVTPPPALTKVTPSSGPEAGGTSAVITGTGFTGATAVTFDGANATFKVNSAAQITATAPAHAVGPARVIVTTPAGSTADTPTDVFTYTTAPPPSLAKYQQTSTSLHFSPSASWTTYSSTSSSGGSYRRASASGSYVIIPFKGTRLDWIATLGIYQGQADVYLDGVFKTTVDLHRSSASYQKVAWSTGDVAAGYHWVKIVRNSGSAGGKFINVDRVDVLGSLVPNARLEQSNTKLLWTPDYATWTTGTTTSASGGTYKYINKAGSVTINFTGVSLSVVAKKALNYGIARVTLDGVAYSVDLYGLTPAYKQPVWSSGFLPPGDHTAVFEWTGSKRASASGTTVTFDAIDVRGELR